MLDESRLRRSDFLGGAAILLADGQLWSFPIPDETIERGRGPSEATRESGSFGPGHGALLEAVREAEDDADALRAELALAIFLLRRNYELDPDHFATLLRFSDRDALIRMQDEMRRVAAAHLRSFRSEGRSALGTSDDRLFRPTPLGAFTS